MFDDYSDEIAINANLSMHTHGIAGSNLQGTRKLILIDEYGQFVSSLLMITAYSQLDINCHIKGRFMKEASKAQIYDTTSRHRRYPNHCPNPRHTLLLGHVGHWKGLLFLQCLSCA